MPAHFSKRSSTVASYVLILFFVCINLFLIPSPGTVDAKDWAPILHDVQNPALRFIPQCLNYECPSNVILTKYPPGYFLLYFIFSFLFPVRLVGEVLSVKILIFLFYILTLLSIVWFVKIVTTQKLDRVIRGVVFLAFGALTLSAQALAYTDIFTFPFFIVSIGMAYQKKYFWAGLWYMGSVLLKWQPIIIAPIYLLYLYRMQAGGDRRALSRFLLGCSAVLISFFLFDHNILSSLWISIRNVMGFHATHALNIAWIIQHVSWTQRVFSPEGWPIPYVVWLQLGLFTLSYAGILRYILIARAPLSLEILLNAMLGGYVSYYLFSFGIAENHFIMATIISLLLYILRATEQSRRDVIAVNIINILNMFLFYGLFGEPILPLVVGGVDFSIVFAGLISIWALRYLIYLFDFPFRMQVR